MKTKIADKSHITIEQCEKLLLSSIIIDNDKIVQVQSLIEPKMLSLEPHKRIYDIMLSLYSRKTVIESSTLWNEIVAKGLNNTFLTKGDIDYIANGCNVLVSGNGAESYATRIANDYVKREAIKFYAGEIEKLQDKAVDKETIISSANKGVVKINGLAKSDGVCEKPSLNPSQILESIRERVESDGQKISGFTYGLKALDSATNGHHRKKLTAILGNNASGKTEFMLETILLNAIAGFSAFIGSFEMDVQELSLRLACKLSDLDSLVYVNPKAWINKKMYEGTFDSVEEGLEYIEKEINHAQELLKTLPIYIYEDYSATMESFSSALDKHVLQNGAVDIVAIDHALLLIQDQVNLVSDLYNICRKSKDIAKKYNCSVLLLAQYSNEVKLDSEFRGDIFRLKGGKAIADNSCTILSIWRADSFQKLIEDKPELKGKSDITIEKIRYAPKPTERIPFIFNGKSFKGVESVEVECDKSKLELEF